MDEIVKAKILSSQYEFVRSNAKKTLFLGGIGCVQKDTLIETNKGPIEISKIKEKGIKYKCFNGLQYSFVDGSLPFEKGFGRMYEVKTKEGEIIVHESHEFLCADLIYRHPRQLLNDLKNGELYALYSTKTDNYPYNLFEDIYRVLDKVFIYIKYLCHHSKSYQKIFSFFLFYGGFNPTLDQVIEFMQGLVKAIEENINVFSIRITNFNSISHPLQNEQLVNFYNEFANELAHLAFDLLPEIKNNNIRRKEIKQRINACIKIWQAHDFRHHPSERSHNKILSIKPLGEMSYWDLKVPNYNNYMAHNMIHHNSGKTSAAGDFIARMLMQYPKAIGLITANTYSQLVNSTVEALRVRLDQLGINSTAVISGSRKRLELWKTHAKLYSLENPLAMRGIEVGWWLSDESAFCDYEAVQVARGRLRDKNGPLYERHTSSGNGFNWLYDQFEFKDGKNKTKETHLIRAETKTNIFLPDGYYETLLEDYGGADNPLAQQELFGKFVNLQSGAIYWAFDRSQHVDKITYKKDHLVYIGQDFNVDKMCNLYIQVFKTSDGENHYNVFQENVLTHRNANTEDAAVKICHDLKDKRKIVIPDSTGAARKSSSRTSESDISIMQSHGLEVMSTSNPLIRDRQNSVNIAFKKNMVTIDKSCKHLIKEIESLSSREDEGKVSHLAVCLGYVVWKFDPVKRNYGKSQSFSL